MEDKRYKSLKKKWPRKNLGEIINFIERVDPDGTSLQNIASRLGVTRASISNTFCRDDMKLSKAEAVCALYGYHLELYFPNTDFLLREDWDMPARTRSYPGAGNLSGLVNYIQRSELPIPYVAELAGFSPGVLYRAFSHGDISIAVLNRCTDALKIMTVWKFVREDGGRQDTAEDTE